MEQENSTQLDSTTFIKKPLVIEPTILKEITSSPDVLLLEDAAPDSEPEEDRSPPKITVQTIDSQGTLKTLSNFSSGKFGRPNSATTQRSTTESGVMRNTKETKMSEWKRELHKDVVSWGYRRCEWSLGLFNTENLFRILCIHFERSFSRVTLDVLFTLGYLALAVCLDGETYGSRPGTYIEFSRIQFFIFQYIQNAWFACGVIAGVVSKGLLEGPMAVIWDIRWIIDLVLVGFVFSHPGFLPLLGVLRIIKILTYIERLGSLIALKEIYCIIRESYQVILSIIGIMVMCGIFVAMLLNNLVTPAVYTSRCRFLTSAGVYKIHDDLKYSCSSSDPTMSCPPGYLCLNKNSPEILLRGVDMKDNFQYTLSFSNIFESLLYIFKVLTNDGWSESFSILMHSELSSTMILLLFLPSIILSILMHGLIVSNFFNTISFIKKMDFEAIRKSKGVEKFALGFMQLLNKNKPKTEGGFSCWGTATRCWSYLMTPYMTVPLGKYQKNWLTTNLMKLMHLRLTKGIDLLSILVYIVLLAYPFDHNDAKIGQLWFANLLNVLMYLYVTMTCLQFFCVGWKDALNMRKIRYDGFVTVLCLLEVCVMSSPYSRFYVLRALEYSQFFQKAALSKHLKILLKCMLHFSVYVLPYLFIKTCILLILTLLAMDFFKPNVYLSETLSDQTQIDLFLRYLATSLQILLVNNWGEIMSRCIYHHGAYVSLYFVIPAVLLRFFLENIMLSLFLHTYSEIYWEYIKVQDNRMGINFEKRGLHKANAIVSTDMRPSPSPRRPSPNILTMDAIRKLVLQSRGSSPTRKSQQWYGQKSPHSTGKLSPVIKAPNDVKKKSVIPSPILIDPLEGEFVDPLKSDYCEFIQDIDTLGLPIIRTRTKLDSSRSFFDKPENSETDSVNNAQDMEILEQLKNIGDGKSPKTPQSGPRGSNLLMPNKRYVSSGFKEMSDQKIKALENLNQEKTSFLQVGSPGTNLIKSSLKPKPKGSQEGTPKHGTPKSQNSGENSRRSSKHGSKRSFHMGKEDVPGLQSPRSGVEDTRRLGNKLLNLKAQMNLGPGFSSHVNRVDTETTRNLLTEENREDPFSSADKTHIEGLFSPRDVQEPPENLTKVPPAISIGKAENLALRGFRKKSSVMPVVHNTLVPTRQKLANMPRDYTRRMGLQIRRSNPNFIKTSTVVKLNPFLSFFTRPLYLRISTITATLQVLANASLTRKNICAESAAKTTFVSLQHCLSFLFCFEIVVSIVIAHHNKNKPVRLRLNPRVPFDWFELALLLSNVATGFVISLGICPNNLWIGIPFLVCSLSAGRLLRRVHYFKRAVSIIWNSAMSLFVAAIFIIQFIVVYSTITSSLFKNTLQACNRDGFNDSPLNPRECITEGGQMSPYFINYNHFFNALFACYTVVDKSQWFMVTDLITMNWNGSPAYNLWHYIYVVLGASVVSLIFRATTISVCYINLGAFSLVNIDKTVTLSEQQREWVQIEEQLASLQLLRKKEKSFHYIVVICRKISTSKLFRGFYNLTLLGGFIVNLAAHNNQPEALRTVQFVANIIVICLVNLHLFLEMQADSWQDVWYDSGKKQRIMMVLFTDVVVIVTQTVGILKEISFQVIYVQIFMVIRDLASSVNSSKSRLMQIYEMFITQIYSYISAIAFVFFMTAIFAFEITFLVDDTTEANGLSGDATAGYLLIWIYDNSWIRYFDWFVRVYNLKDSSVGLGVLVVLYIAHFIYKNIIHRMFISVVVDGYQRVQEMNNFVFGKESIDILLKHWMKYDPMSNGLITVNDYFEFLMNLPPPLRLSLEELLMRADVDPEDFISYSNRKVFRKSFSNDLCLTVKQFYEFLNVYNLPVYVFEGKTYVHFRDVAKLLTKVAIENKYGNSESLWDMTEKLKLALKDMWYARYPQLVELKENFHQISVDAFGTRMKGFDTKMYQAAETMRETYKRRKRLVEAKRILTNYALKIIQNDGVDEVNKDRLQAMMREDGILSSKRMFHHILSDFQQKKRLTSSGSKYTKEESLSQDIQSQTAKFPGRPEEPSEPVRHHKSIFSQGAVLTERLVQTAENSRGTTIEFSIPKLKLKFVKPSDALKRSDTIKKKGSNANDTSVRKSKRKKDMSFQNSNSESPYLAETAEEMGQQVEILEEIQDFEQIGLHNFVHKLKTEEGQEGSFSSSNQDSSDQQDSPTPQKQPVIVVQAIDSPPPTRGAPNTPQMPRAITLRKNKSLKGPV